MIRACKIFTPMVMIKVHAVPCYTLKNKQFNSMKINIIFFCSLILVLSACGGNNQHKIKMRNVQANKSSQKQVGNNSMNIPEMKFTNRFAWFAIWPMVQVFRECIRH